MIGIKSTTGVSSTAEFFYPFFLFCMFIYWKIQKKTKKNTCSWFLSFSFCGSLLGCPMFLWWTVCCYFDTVNFFSHFQFSYVLGYHQRTVMAVGNISPVSLQYIEIIAGSCRFYSCQCITVAFCVSLVHQLFWLLVVRTPLRGRWFCFLMLLEFITWYFLASCFGSYSSLLCLFSFIACLWVIYLLIIYNMFYIHLLLNCSVLFLSHHLHGMIHFFFKNKFWLYLGLNEFFPEKVLIHRSVLKTLLS